MSLAVILGVASFVGSLLGTAVIVGIAWGKVSATISAHSRWLAEHEEKLDHHAADIVELKTLQGVRTK